MKSNWWSYMLLSHYIFREFGDITHDRINFSNKTYSYIFILVFRHFSWTLTVDDHIILFHRILLKIINPEFFRWNTIKSSLTRTRIYYQLLLFHKDLLLENSGAADLLPPPPPPISERLARVSCSSVATGVHVGTANVRTSRCTHL